MFASRRQDRENVSIMINPLFGKSKKIAYMLKHRHMQITKMAESELNALGRKKMDTASVSLFCLKLRFIFS